MRTLKLSLRQLQIFRQVARRKSVSAAADELGISQPQVSRTLAEIEKKLGTEVFFRTPEGLELTPTGKLLLNFAEQTLSLAGETERAISEKVGVPACPLHVAVPPGLLSYAALGIRAFHEEYPELPIRLEVGTPERVLELVTRQQVALGLFAGPESLLPREVASEEVGEQPWGLLAPESLAETPLPKLPLVLPPEGSLLRRVLEHATGHLPESPHHAADVRAACALATTGFGAYLPLACTEVGLVVHKASPKIVLPIHAVYPEHGRYPVSARAYVRLLSGLKPPITFFPRPQ